MTLDEATLRRHTTVVLGALFFTGAVWVTISLLVPTWPQLRNEPLIWGTVGAAYVVGLGTMWWGRYRAPLSDRVAQAIVALGTTAATLVVIGGGPHAAGAYGGFYGYVTAISFLAFTWAEATVQLVYAGAAYAVALALVDAPGAVAQWVVVVGIATGGAGLVGFVGQRLRGLYLAERDIAARIAEADRLKSTFLQAVSHELRTPLAAVRGYASTLDQHLQRLSPDQLELMLERLRFSAERLDTLVQDLLDVDRLQRGDARARREPTDVGVVVAQAVDTVERAEHPLELDAPSFVVNVEPSKLERIVANLVANAVKHTPAGTCIAVSVEPDPDTGGLHLVVADDGPGIDEDVRAGLFQPFTQGRDAAGRASPGTGIGLALVERFTALHGGRVGVRDGPGGGVAFDVWIPDGDPDHGDRPLGPAGAGADHRSA